MFLNKGSHYDEKAFLSEIILEIISKKHVRLKFIENEYTKDICSLISVDFLSMIHDVMQIYKVIDTKHFRW